MSPPELARWPEVGDRFTSLAAFKLACFRFGASIGCELRVLKSQPDNIYIGCNLPDRRRHARTCDFRISCRVRGQEAVVTNVKAKAGHSCDPVELERRRQSGQAAEAMRNKIAKFDGGAAAAARKRRREIGVEGMSTTLSKKGTPLSYAGVDVKDYAPSGERAQLPTLSESFPKFDDVLKLCRLYATSRDFWLDYRWQPDEQQYCLECTQGRKTRASSSSGSCPYSVIIRQDSNGLWYRRPSKLEHDHSIKHVTSPSTLDDGGASSQDVLSVSWSRPSQQNAPPDDLVAFAAGLRQPILGAGEAYQDAQALVALGVHSIHDLVQLASLAPSTVQAMIAECESGGRAEGVLKALLQARV